MMVYKLRRRVGKKESTKEMAKLSKNSLCNEIP